MSHQRGCVLAFGDEVALIAARERILAQNHSCVYCAAQLDSPLPPHSQFYAFKHSRNALGQTFNCALLDCSHNGKLHFHLESLAIVAACIKAGGCLYILLPDYAALESLPDGDSQRWNNQNTIATPHFMAFFKALVAQFGWPVVDLNAGQPLPIYTAVDYPPPQDAIAAQQAICTNVLTQQPRTTLITAHRGRGKSALLGQLVRALAGDVVVTAANKSAVTTLRQFAQCEPHFVAPDALLAQFAQGRPAPKWLVIDEAAMLPLSVVASLLAHAQHSILATTIDGYEGTGQGFVQKWLQDHPHAYHVQLHTPLRWAENDRLEQWVNALIGISPCSAPSVADEGISHVARVADKLACYQLLRQAHYRTTPLDLRRMLDASGQLLYQHTHATRCIAALWAVGEGGLPSALSTAIYRGERQPPGNLVAQLLCFQAGLKAAATLNSIRISRIAVAQAYRRHGHAKALIEYLISQHRADFYSVSFGYTPELAQFWQKCGFEIVHITPFKEASSGLFSAVALLAISPAGRELLTQAKVRFARDFPLSEHPLCSAFPHACDFTLQASDYQALYDFAHTNRTLHATLPALKRFLHNQPNVDLSHALDEVRGAQVNQKVLLKAFKVRLKEYLA
ncbi:tRNA(Met) cytidine acetyltransferase [Pasteurellaceae bacterium HPA106]|uniref:GNAT family N-acetyltransferase n=1 Tax=Spirabiliibacterium pneumoniae TaxID=221400 RepID=UPI001AACD9C6|nr:GNAT family N-acetyltransferase [Spirabiliibacterium pneumoniae]MBE2896642.1 tRNA(Met) cytidine acetyltransferase [Spirabiliibacterium pneumoniae]